MKTFALSFFLASQALVAQDAPMTPSKAASLAAGSADKCVILIDPKARTQDYVQAFDLLRKDKPTLKIMIRTSSGMILSNIVEVLASEGGTLLIVKFLSSQGNRYQLVPIEEIVEMNYS